MSTRDICAGSKFAGFRFPAGVIVVAVRWCLRNNLFYRDVEELARTRVEVDHVTVFRDAELPRLIELGATTIDDRRNVDGTGWVVLADPEGNEFCILRSNDEVAAGPT